MNPNNNPAKMLGVLSETLGGVRRAFQADAPGSGDYVPYRVRHEEIDRPKLSGILPYVGFLPAERVFTTNTGIGFCLELLPQSGANQEMADILSSLYASCPAGTGVQFHLFSNPGLLGEFMRYGRMRPKDGDADEAERLNGRPVRNRNIYRAMVRKQIDYLMRGTRQSLFPHCGYLLRDFRLVCSVIMSGNEKDAGTIESLVTLREGMSQTLKSAGFPASEMSADDLINFLHPILNPTKMFSTRPSETLLNYDDGRPIKSQIVERDTVCRVSPKGLIFGLPDEGEIEVRSYSPLSYPKSFPLWRMGALIGDFFQDTVKYSCPFMITMGVHVLDFSSTKNAAIIKGARATQNASSQMAKYAPEIQAQKQDWDAVVKRLDEGHGMVRMYHQLTLFSQRSRATHDELNAMAVWRSAGFTLASDRYMQKQALLASLPLTLCKEFAAELKQDERISTKTTHNAVHLAPMLGEWKGSGDPVMAYFGRRGQLMWLDFFSNRQGNYNVAITGVSGSGKTALMNYIILSYLGIGAKVFIIDIGRGYEKLCRVAGGKFIEFLPSNPICINPFSWVENISEDMKMLKPLLAKMASPSTTLANYQYAKLEEAISRIWERNGRDSTVTDVASYLLNECFEGDGAPDRRARDIGVQLYPYTKNGMYGKFFEGPATIDLNGDLVVLELEELKSSKDLQKVVLFIVMYRITYEMYLSRDRKKICPIDEAWQFFDDEGDTVDFVEEGYRRARRYNGSFISGTQGVRDYYKTLGSQATYVNADWKIYLRQDAEQIETLEKEGRLVLGEAMKRQILSLKTESGMFSEAVVRSPMGGGIVRIILDPFTLLLASSMPDDFNAISAKRAMGMDVTEAIESVLADRGIA